MFRNDADRLAFIKGLGGQLVRVDDKDVWAVFESDAAFVDQGVEVEANTPILDPCRTVDVKDVAKDAPVLVGSEAYRVKRVEPDVGSGMSRVLLKR